VGPNATVTSFFQRDVDAALAVRDLQRAVAADPSTENLLALAEGWWQVNDADNAKATYERIVNGSEPVPALALRRLGFLALETDPALARDYLQRANTAGPGDVETLFFLGELSFAFGDLAAARSAWSELLPLPDAAEVHDHVAGRLKLLDQAEPLLLEVQAGPDAANLAALADVFWAAGEQERAVDLYFQILTEFDPLNGQALGRTGQLLFLRGRIDDAVMLLDRAASLGNAEPETLLFLGNGQFSLEDYGAAIAAWEQYLAVAGPEAAGRVPGLIAEAQSRLAGGQPSQVQLELPADASRVLAADPGRELFVANCSACHGPDGGGGTGPRLLGNSRAANTANVSNLIRFGRGMMPAFNALLTPDEIELLIDYVSELADG
jgi:mono/diheme cytochrome c family protein/thioredoxin-like negative regulator of GroEL